MLRTVTDGGRRVGLLPRRRLRGMTWSGHELPMAPRLRARRRSLVAQLDRYRRLGTTAISITHREQTVETINESRATRERDRAALFSSGAADDARNLLIWGDNKLVMSSLATDYAGKIDLIYIDPPFAT